MNFTVEYSNRPEERENSHLILLLHGYGSNEKDLIGLVPHLPRTGITYASLRAPQPVGATLEDDAVSAHIPGAAFGYQWYPLDSSLNTGQKTVELASDFILSFLEAEAQNYASISLLGFSQGMAMATTLARHRPDLIASVIGLSGFVVEAESDYFKDDDFVAAQLPFFYGRGDADPVIPQAKVDFTEGWLPSRTVLETHIYPGMAHAVSPAEISDISAFIEKNILAR